MRMRKNQAAREEDYAAMVLADIEENPDGEETSARSGPEHSEQSVSPGGVPLSVVMPSPEEHALDERQKKQIIRRHKGKAEAWEHLAGVLTRKFGVPEGEASTLGKSLDLRRISPDEAAQTLARRNEELLAYRKGMSAFIAAREEAARSPAKGQETPGESPAPPISAAPLKEDPFGDLESNIPSPDPKATDAETEASTLLREAVRSGTTEEPSRVSTPERPSFRKPAADAAGNARPMASAERSAGEPSRGVGGVGKAAVLLRENREPYTAMLLEDGNVVLLHEKTGKFTSIPLDEMKARFVTVEGQPVCREDFLSAGENQRRSMTAPAGASPGPGTRSMPQGTGPGPGRENALAANLVTLMAGGIRFAGAFFNECLKQCLQSRERATALSPSLSMAKQPTEAAAPPQDMRFGPVDTEGMSTMEAYRIRRAARLYDGMCEKMDRVEIALDALSENAAVKEFRLRLLENPAASQAILQDYGTLLRESSHPDVQDARVKTAVLFEMVRELQRDLPETSRAFGLVDQRAMSKLNERMRRFSRDVDARPESAFLTDLKTEEALKEKVGGMLERMREILENTFRSFLGRKMGEEVPSPTPC